LEGYFEERSCSRILETRRIASDGEELDILL
jgi:hypothetical protein